jgi:NADH-quinone oxidoreductase subunit H
MNIDFALILEWFIKSFVIILGMAGGFAYATYYERRLLARMQVRIGPNRAGPMGLLQPVADGIKLFVKEELIPANADKLIFLLAPVITVVPSLIVTAVVPWGTSINLFGRNIPLYLADLNVGILYILTVTSISVYGVTLAGWSSNNKYATLGGLRATSQMMSYELSMGLAILGPILIVGSMSLLDIVNAQKDLWFVVLQPVAFIIFFITSTAEVNRPPFDMPEAEQELTAGYHTEYSGMKFALFFMAEYVKFIAVAMIGVSLFLGGFRGPFIDTLPGLGPVYFILKTVIWLGVVIWLRATLPRFRYDRLMSFEWKILLPIALANVMVTGIVLVLTDLIGG